MANVLKISEAASLGIHTMVFLARTPNRLFSVGTIAAILGASEAHLSKVLQRLGKKGLVMSTRGPNGGFMIGKDPTDITLLEVFEAIEGPLESVNCLLGKPVCNGNCILGDLLTDVDRQVKDYFSGKRLCDLTQAYEGVA